MFVAGDDVAKIVDFGLHKVVGRLRLLDGVGLGVMCFS